MPNQLRHTDQGELDEFWQMYTPVQTPPYPTYRTFSSSPKVPLFCFPVSHPMQPQLMWLLTCLQSLQGRSVISRVAFKCIHILCSLLCRASLAEHWYPSQCCWDISSSSLPIDRQYSIVYLSHILFIYLPIDGHLCGFQCLATMPNAMMHICVPTSLCGHVFSFLLGRHLGVKLLGPMIWWNLYRTAKMLSNTVVPGSTLGATQEHSSCSAPSPGAGVAGGLCYTHPSGVKLWSGVKPLIVALICAFPLWLTVVRVFMCVLSVCTSSFGKCLFNVFTHFY